MMAVGGGQGGLGLSSMGNAQVGELPSGGLGDQRTQNMPKTTLTSYNEQWRLGRCGGQWFDDVNPIVVMTPGQVVRARV